MRNHEKMPPQVEGKQFDNFEDIPKDPKQEGLRPYKQYAGGNPNEIITVANKKYTKKTAMRAFNPRNNESRPYTEKEYYSHSTDDVGPGPDWDSVLYYLKDGWGIRGGNPKHLSDLPLYELVPLEE